MKVPNSLTGQWLLVKIQLKSRFMWISSTSFPKSREREGWNTILHKTTTQTLYNGPLNTAKIFTCSSLWDLKDIHILHHNEDSCQFLVAASEWMPCLFLAAQFCCCTQSDGDPHDHLSFHSFHLSHSFHLTHSVHSSHLIHSFYSQRHPELSRGSCTVESWYLNGEIENITCLCMNTNFIFKCSSEHSKIKTDIHKQACNVLVII